MTYIKHRGRKIPINRPTARQPSRLTRLAAWLLAWLPRAWLEAAAARKGGW